MMTQLMNAALLTGHGGAEKLVYTQVAKPSPQAGEIVLSETDKFIVLELTYPFVESQRFGLSTNPSFLIPPHAYNDMGIDLSLLPTPYPLFSMKISKIYVY